MTLLQISIFYKNLAEMHSAGIGFISLFDSLKSAEVNEHRRLQLQFVIEHLRKGQSLTESLQKTQLIPVLDIPIIRAAENSGKLLQIFESLSKKYQLNAQTEKNIRAGLIMPFFTLVASFFILPFADLFTAKISVAGYCFRSFGPFGALIAIVYFFYKRNMKAYFDSTLAIRRHNICLNFPYIRGLSQKMALEKFVSSLSFMLEAGLSVFESLEYAGRSSADIRIHKSSQNIQRLLKVGSPLPQAFRSESIFPAEIINSIVLGSESGKLPAFLQRTGIQLNNEINDTLTKLSKVLPAMIYWFISLYIAWRIIDFYTSHLNDLNSVL